MSTSTIRLPDDKHERLKGSCPSAWCRSTARRGRSTRDSQQVTADSRGWAVSLDARGPRSRSGSPAVCCYAQCRPSWRRRRPDWMSASSR